MTDEHTYSAALKLAAKEIRRLREENRLLLVAISAKDACITELEHSLNDDGAWNDAMVCEPPSGPQSDARMGHE